MTSADVPSLTGFTVAITASRRVDEFATMLRRRGADVVAAAAIQMVPLADDDAPARRHRRRDRDAARRADRDHRHRFPRLGRGGRELGRSPRQLLDALRSARVISRGPKATGALRTAGLREEWSPASESSEEVLAHLSADNLDGKRIAVQLHGVTDDWNPVPEFPGTLAERGATVVAVPVYRWEPPADLAELDASDRAGRARRRRRRHVHVRAGGRVVPDAGQRVAAHRVGDPRPDDDGDTVLRRAGDRAPAGQHRGAVGAARADATRRAGPRRR